MRLTLKTRLCQGPVRLGAVHLARRPARAARPPTVAAAAAKTEEKTATPGWVSVAAKLAAAAGAAASAPAGEVLVIADGPLGAGLALGLLRAGSRVTLGECSRRQRRGDRFPLARPG